ncbi:hypothetical protein IEQ34_020604 [Dendrobium chrysotoxum]|uniref:Uncharacterized protein n=1 Tax=Dendrobium chrysotoxum TaxID=161865 RepID=A0AAV7G386_DENCH|nr:hypothetical protein IEQ34_020604 [Dendrobium chrysotoxum]
MVLESWGSNQRPLQTVGQQRGGAEFFGQQLWDAGSPWTAKGWSSEGWTSRILAIIFWTATRSLQKEIMDSSVGFRMVGQQLIFAEISWTAVGDFGEKALVTNGRGLGGVMAVEKSGDGADHVGRGKEFLISASNSFPRENLGVKWKAKGRETGGFGGRVRGSRWWSLGEVVAGGLGKRGGVGRPTAMFHFLNNLIVKTIEKSDQVCFPPLRYLNIYEMSLRVGIRYPPALELIDILTACGVSLSQFSCRAMSIVMGLIAFFRDRRAVLISELFFVKNEWNLIEKWGKLKELQVPIHVGAEDIMRTLNIPDVECLLYVVRYLEKSCRKR